ncbi:uncharacterized membrane protein YhaH (DUF805 family) [Kitasatospora sp. GAS204A]|uniref:DUF6114 domain-containing protein n=1 Tax=unclassified Kitasatospora TaxID=2633591 RepID=UPI00247D6575|nr:uncharacterized membrane protein YhaH (DUF805 family) [Kitasatospora sp. GAS204B]
MADAPTAGADTPPPDPGEPAASAEPAAETTPEPAPAPDAAPPPPVPARSFKAWRGRRPFWGGVLVTLAGGEILLTMKAPLPVILHIGMQGMAGFLVPLILLLCGLLLLFNPAQRVFYSVLAVLLTLATWVTSNLGGFLLGLLLGLIGSTLAFGWLPEQPSRRRLFGRSRRAASPR